MFMTICFSNGYTIRTHYKTLNLSSHNSLVNGNVTSTCYFHFGILVFYNIMYYSLQLLFKFGHIAVTMWNVFKVVVHGRQQNVL